MKSLIAIALLVGAASLAQADTSTVQPPLECGISFHAHGGGVQVLIGKFQLKGTGVVKCQDQAGNVERIPVNVTMGGHIAALRVAAGYLNIAGVATGVGYTKSPDDLMGRYELAGAQASAIVGAGVQVAARAAKGSTTLNLTLQAADGIGFDAGISSLRIERADNED